MSLLRGRRYNRAKKTRAEAGAIGGASKGQNDTCLSDTADRLAKEHGISPAMIKRDGKVAAFLEKHPEEAAREIGRRWRTLWMLFLKSEKRGLFGCPSVPEPIVYLECVNVGGAVGDV